jgi:hypothetical protein
MVGAPRWVEPFFLYTYIKSLVRAWYVLGTYIHDGNAGGCLSVALTGYNWFLQMNDAAGLNLPDI